MIFLLSNPLAAANSIRNMPWKYAVYLCAQIGEGANMKGNNGFESKAMMEEFKQRIAERTGKAPPVSE